MHLKWKGRRYPIPPSAVSGEGNGLCFALPWSNPFQGAFISLEWVKENLSEEAAAVAYLTRNGSRIEMNLDLALGTLRRHLAAERIRKEVRDLFPVEGGILYEE